MKIGKAITIDWELIGATLANESNDAQIKFFKGFCNEVNSWDTNFQKETQMLYIRDGLSKNQKEILSTITWESEASNE